MTTVTIGVSTGPLTAQARTLRGDPAPDRSRVDAARRGAPQSRCGCCEGGDVARPGQRRSGGARADLGAQRRRAPRLAEQGIIPVLAEVAREVDRAVQRPPTRPVVRTKFQVVALLVREERARVMADGGPTESGRAKQLKRLDGVETLLARTAARDTSLLELLAEDDRVSAAADAYPLLVVVPNVVKTNWAHEVRLWTPSRRSTVVHGDGDRVDGFADIVIVNYELLDRHVGWLGDLGFRGMVVDEAHFINNKTSQRSQHVLALSERLRARTARPLLMALTGTPLINDIEDFRAIWQLLGWIDDTMPLGALMAALEETA